MWSSYRCARAMPLTIDDDHVNKIVRGHIRPLKIIKTSFYVSGPGVRDLTPVETHGSKTAH